MLVFSFRRSLKIAGNQTLFYNYIAKVISGGDLGT